MVALALVWLQIDLKEKDLLHISVHGLHAHKKTCAGESWGGSEWDCCFQEKKKDEGVTPVTQTSVFLLVDQGMVGAS